MDLSGSLKTAMLLRLYIACLQFPAKRSVVSVVFTQISAVKIQVAQLSQRDRASGWVSYGHKWKTGTDR